MNKALDNFVKKGLFYKSVVEDGSDIIFVVDYQGKILYHNASVEDTLGYKPNNLVDKNFFDFILPESLADFKRKYQTCTKKQYQKSIEFQFLCTDKSYKYLEFNSINLKEKKLSSRNAQKIEGLILDCRDITQRKNDAEELMRAQKTKDLFLANISHEIRTPLNGIAGMATLLSQRPNREEQITYLNAIKNASENLKVIINDILDLASIESGKLKFERIGFSLKDVLTSLVNMFQVQAREKGISVSSHLTRNADKILIGDPVRLNQILINLISNALKFTHTGSIKLKCSVEKMERKRVFLQFKVSDTGIGIPSDKLTTIFESFSQADASVTRKYGGTGLGLTIVKQLVDLQNGTIDVESEEDKGSTFTVTIPYLLGSPKDITEISSQARKSQSYLNSLKTLNILLVEDNDINRLYATNILKSWDCLVETAENGYVALEKIKNSLFDLILMDVQMPVMDGFEATKAIRMTGPPKSEVPIIALTANATRKDIEKCLMAGMNDCISKPFTPDDLFGVLVKYSGRKSVPEQKVTVETRKVEKPVVTPANAAIDLTYLKKVSNNSPEFIQDMVTAFLEAIPKTVEEIKSLVHDRQWTLLAKAVHKLRPSLTMMGMPDAKELSIQIENSAMAPGAKDTIPAQVQELVVRLEKALQELQQVRI